MTRSDLMTEARKTVDRYTALGNEKLNMNMKTPRLDFSLRGTTAGIYRSKTHTIRVNMVLLSENFEHYLDQTIPHELAHGLTHFRYGLTRRIRPHGNEWKSVMRAIGKNPSRCHTYDVSNAQVRKVSKGFKYACGCKTYDFTIIRHRRAMKALTMGGKYACRRCNGTIVYQG